MVERIPIAHPLTEWKLWQCPGPKNGLPASHCLQTAGCTIGTRWLMDHPVLPGIAGVKGFPSPKRFQGSSGLLHGAG